MAQIGVLYSIGIVLVLYLFARLFVNFVSKRPNLGYKNNQFAPCNPANCVCTDDTNSAAYISPIKYSGSLEEAKEMLLKAIRDYGRTRIIINDRNYIYAEFRSLTWGFIDDVEFFFNDIRKEILLRSGSRIGTTDSGENRKRIERLRIAFQGKSLKEVTSKPISISLIPKKEVKKVFFASIFCSSLIFLTYFLYRSDLDILHSWILIGFTLFSFAFAFLIPSLKRVKPMRAPTIAWIVVLVVYGITMELYLLMFAGIIQIYMDFGFYNAIEVKQWEFFMKSEQK